MALAAGTHLGPYEIGTLLGSGGMGEVYRARDTRLDRTVAIKVLPAHIASDPDSRQRFEREARAIAALNHPHICVLHDVGHDNGTDFLVMEHLQGQTLAERLEKGALSLDLALRYGVEIADALDKAHRHGVVHRDLKPANVMITKSGAKLLDFGIAKLRLDSPISVGVSQVATESVPLLTDKGTIVGTMQYMAPEQLEGKDVDARTDIFALGVLLYEMVTGQRAFSGSSRASLMAAILEHEPRKLTELQPLSPPALEHVIQGCLAKSPDDRWQTAHDVMKQLKWIAASDARTTDVTRAPSRRSRLKWSLTFGLLALGAAGVFGAIRYGRVAQRVEQTRFAIATPEMFNPTQFSISPDGRYVVFVARSSPSAPSLLYVRQLDSIEPQPLVGTEGASDPFWSPDSQNIGFAARGKLKRIDVSGGSPQDICDTAGTFTGGTWNADGVIVFSTFPGALRRVLASGGEPVSLTVLDEKNGETAHVWPWFLPDGRHFLFQVVGNRAGGGIQVAALDAAQPVTVMRAGSMPLYAAPGYLLFHRDRALMAQEFDSDRLSTIGEPVRLVDGLALSTQNTRGAAAVSNTGTLLYRTGTAGIQTQLTWYDRTGKALGSVGAPGEYRGIALSPDNKHVAVHLHQEPTGGDIWVLDQERGTSTRLTFNPSHNMVPTWSRDGRFIAFSSDRDGGNAAIYRKSSSGAGDDELMLKIQGASFPEDWSPDQQSMTFGHQEPRTRMDVWVVALTGERKPTPLVNTEFSDILSKFSPDGRWIAYTSNESGRNEIYVQPYLQRTGKWQISNGGANFVRWASNSKELFYLTPDGTLMGVDVQGDATAFKAGIPKPLFKSRAMFGDHQGNVYAYDVSSDAQRFLINERLSDSVQSVPITAVLNWTAALKR